MSGQMTNGEIEDVLASIRRLLRDDDTAAAADGATAQRPRRLVLNPDSMVLGDPATTAPRPDVLVLTDPQMGGDAFGSDAETGALADAGEPSWNAPLILSDPVILPHAPAAEVDTPAASFASGPERIAWSEAAALRATRPRSGVRSDRAASLEDRIAELEAALARDEAEWETDGGDPEVIAPVDDLRALDEIEEGVDDLLALDGVTAPMEQGDDGAAGAADWPDDGADVTDQAVLADVAAAPGALTAADVPLGAEAQTEGAPQAADPGATGPRPRMSEDEVRAWIEAEALSAFGTTLGELVSETDGGPVVAVAQTPEDVAPEELATDPAADAWHPEWPEAGSEDAPADLPAGGAGSDPSGHGPEGDPQAEVAAASMAPVPPTRGPEVQRPAPSSLDPAMADEIRRIVSDVIRDELRGPLGEQLTRSIRRLVRRELALIRDPDAPR